MRTQWFCGSRIILYYFDFGNEKACIFMDFLVYSFLSDQIISSSDNRLLQPGCAWSPTIGSSGGKHNGSFTKRISQTVKMDRRKQEPRAMPRMRCYVPFGGRRERKV